MTWEQRDAFLAAAAAEPRYTTLLPLLAKTGVRPGQGFALRPGDIDWGERTVRVERAWNLGGPDARSGSRARPAHDVAQDRGAAPRLGGA